jgi:hypothetical protein
MLEQDADPDQRYGTRWLRGGTYFLPVLLVIGGLGDLMARGVLATGFNVEDSAFTLASNEITGTGFGAVMNNPTMETSATTTANNVGMARAGFASAQLAGLCGVVTQTIPYGTGNLTFYLQLTAGQAVQTSYTPTSTFTPDINASNLFLEVTNLNVAENTVLNNANLGESADQVNVGGTNLGGSAGMFGLDASQGSVSIVGLNATAYTAEISGSLTLPGLDISVSTTKPTC